MALLWPGFLVLLVLLPVLIGLYLLMLRRRRRFAVRYSSLALVREALPHHSRWRRHLPFALFLLAMASLILALVRPVIITTIPTNQTTIILTMDVSGSMRFRDIQPSRLGAAESAALNFIQHQKATTQIGIVAFSTISEIIQPPTTDQSQLESAIESLTTGRMTAIGSGILSAIDAISQVDKLVPPSVQDPATQTEPTPVPKGAYVPDIIVLLTDGVSNVGPDPLAAAQQAADRGIRVYTIGFGTRLGPSRGQFGNPFGFGGGSASPFGGANGFFGGGRFRAGIDETTLKQIASLTGGAYYSASSAGELQKVFNSLPTYLIMKHETTEISVAFAALGALLAAFALILSLLWHPLP